MKNIIKKGIVAGLALLSIAFVNGSAAEAHDHDGWHHGHRWDRGRVYGYNQVNPYWGYNRGWNNGWNNSWHRDRWRDRYYPDYGNYFRTW